MFSLSFFVAIKGENFKKFLSDEPHVYIKLIAFDLGVEKNKQISKALMDELEVTMGAHPERMTILFTNPTPSEVGFNRSTLADFI